MTLKIAVFAPMPSASVTMATRTSPGTRRSVRSPWRMSWKNVMTDLSSVFDDDARRGQPGFQLTTCRQATYRWPTWLAIDRNGPPLTSAVFHVLVALADEERHGYALLKAVEAQTDGTVRLSTGTLYGIINRLLADGAIADRTARDGKRVYRLTPLGREMARAEADRPRRWSPRREPRARWHEISSMSSRPTARCSACPFDFRREYGEEMAGVFDEHRDARGMSASARLWTGRSAVCSGSRRASTSRCSVRTSPTPFACCAARLRSRFPQSSRSRSASARTPPSSASRTPSSSTRCRSPTCRGWCRCRRSTARIRGIHRSRPTTSATSAIGAKRCPARPRSRSCPSDSRQRRAAGDVRPGRHRHLLRCPWRSRRSRTDAGTARRSRERRIAGCRPQPSDLGGSFRIESLRRRLHDQAEHPFTIVGVAPPRFNGTFGLFGPDLFVLFMMSTRSCRARNGSKDAASAG